MALLEIQPKIHANQKDSGNKYERPGHVEVYDLVDVMGDEGAGICPPGRPFLPQGVFKSGKRTVPAKNLNDKREEEPRDVQNTHSRVSPPPVRADKKKNDPQKMDKNHDIGQENIRHSPSPNPLPEGEGFAKSYKITIRLFDKLSIMGEEENMDETRPVRIPIDGVLDLHTFDPREVGELLPEYIRSCRERGIFEVRVIHGKGTGALRGKVHFILRQLAEVSSFRLADEGAGGWGATIVYLKRP